MFQDITNKRNNISSSSSFQQQLQVIEKSSTTITAQQQHQNQTNGSKINFNSSSSSSSSSPSAARKRTQTWIEGAAILNHRHKIVTADVEDAWDHLMSEIAPTSSFSLNINNNNNNNNNSESFLNEFGFSSSNESERGLSILSYPSTKNDDNASSFFPSLETEQVIATHRQLRQSRDKLKKDELGVANLVSNATEELDLGEGLRGTSVARVRSANQTIESALVTLKEEERALGDVVGEAERVLANVTKRMMMSPAWKAKQQQNQYFDPFSSFPSSLLVVGGEEGAGDHYQQHQQQQHRSTTTTSAFSSSPSHVSADEKLRLFLDRVGGRSFGWPRQEHDCFMHILFSGGFEDPAVTNATPNLGLRNGLADDEQWVAAQVVERLSPLLPHRLPDDIRKHLALQRELEFLEGQRRLEVKSWRDQREADAALDMGVAAALAREDADLEHEHRRETEFERRARQEHLHELVETWKVKKEEAAATAKAAMAVTQRAMEDAKQSKRVAMQAATRERNNQLLERRQMLKNAALWSSAARALGCSSSPSNNNNNHNNFGGDSSANFANRQHNIPLSCSSNMDKAALNYALQERREHALNKARERRAAVEAIEKQKTEREDRMKIRAEMVRMVPTVVADEGRSTTTTGPSRLLQPTKSVTARREATIEQETAANLNSKALCRQTPYLTPRTMLSHKRGAPFM